MFEFGKRLNLWVHESVNPWQVWSPARGIKRYPISYVAEGARGSAANNEIIRLNENVPLIAFVSNKILSLSPGESFSWFADFSRRHRPGNARGNKYLTWFFFQPSALSLDPSSDLLLGPSPGEFPLLVTSFSMSPVPVLFPQSSGMFTPRPLSRYLLPPFHFLSPSDAYRFFTVVVSFLTYSRRHLVFPSLVCISVEEFLFFPYYQSSRLLTFSTMKLWYNVIIDLFI